nr:hemagglutinin [Hyalangium gracile]
MSALAEPDVFGLGNGQHGALRVQQLDTTINVATALTAPAGTGSKALTVASVTGFAAGELVLVHQAFSESLLSETGPTLSLEKGSSGAGRWELARVESVAAGRLTLTAPLVSSFAAPGSQVVRVPEHTTVHVHPQASLVAPAWNGTTGGVLAFFATDAVLNQGLLSATAAGFRGGTYAFNRTQTSGCTELHLPQDKGGARKGEGLFSAVSGAPTHGYGALGNGAGGGNCGEGGGGGGGHGGVGGQGGYTSVADGSRDVGGRGGQALRYSPLSRMLFGGGGGAGAGDSNGAEGTTGSSGGAGGGIIYMRARSLQGQGLITANGKSADASLNDASGGGGAGGYISLRVEDRLDCLSLEARGGNGGNNTDGDDARAPGGGGGGGVLLLQARTLACDTSLVPGLAGTAAGVQGGGPYGATPTDMVQLDHQGVPTLVNEAFATPAAPVWTTPAEGEATGPRPQLQGRAVPGSTVQVFLDEQPLGSVEVAIDGSFTFQPSAALPEGPHQARASAERLGVRGALSEPRAFTVGALSPLALEVGCGCGSTPANGGLWLALACLLLGVSRRRPAARGSRRPILAERGPPGIHLYPGAPARLPGHRNSAGRCGRAGG